MAVHMVIEDSFWKKSKTAVLPFFYTNNANCTNLNRVFLSLCHIVFCVSLAYNIITIKTRGTPHTKGSNKNESSNLFSCISSGTGETP
jgi:hypothetical protein